MYIRLCFLQPITAFLQSLNILPCTNHSIFKKQKCHVHVVRISSAWISPILFYLYCTLIILIHDFALSLLPRNFWCRYTIIFTWLSGEMSASILSNWPVSLLILNRMAAVGVAAFLTLVMLPHLIFSHFQNKYWWFLSPLYN